MTASKMVAILLEFIIYLPVMIYMFSYIQTRDKRLPPLLVGKIQAGFRIAEQGISNWTTVHWTIGIFR